MSDIDAIDLLDTARDLTTCAKKIVESDIQQYHRKPFVTLMMVIEEKIEEAQKEIRSEFETHETLNTEA